MMKRSMAALLLFLTSLHCLADEAPESEAAKSQTVLVKLMQLSAVLQLAAAPPETAEEAR